MTTLLKVTPGEAKRLARNLQGKKPKKEATMKYIFTNQNYKPICIAYYDNDARAIEEAEKLSGVLGYVVYVCRHLEQP